MNHRSPSGLPAPDGRYDLLAYLDDVEAIRDHMGIARWHLLGHSWGGLLAQACTAAYPQRVKSLVLSSSSLDVGADWKRTKRAAFRTNRTRAGLWGTLRYAIEGVSGYEGPALVLYGAYDIFAAAAEIVRSRLPRAVQVTLEDSGHLHWLQNPSAYANALHQFYDHARDAQ